MQFKTTTTRRAQEFLEQKLNSILEDKYTLAITTYALQIVRSRRTQFAIRALLKLATRTKSIFQITLFWQNRLIYSMLISVYNILQNFIFLAISLIVYNSIVITTVFTIQNRKQLTVSCIGGMYWHEEHNYMTDYKSQYKPNYVPPSTMDIEMTSYALLTFTRRNDIQKMVPIMKWLVSKRTTKGGFRSIHVKHIL